MKQPIEKKAARLGSRGGRYGTLTHRESYPTRSKGARPNPAPWRPVSIGDLVDEVLTSILKAEVQS